MNKDTLKLLHEGIAGCKMGINTLDAVMPKVENEKLRRYLEEVLRKHVDIMLDIQICLYRQSEDTKEPSKMARDMAKLTIGMKTKGEDVDQKILDIVIEGLDMGIKELNENLNEHEDADDCAKETIKRLISLEEENKTYLCDKKYLEQ